MSGKGTKKTVKVVDRGATTLHEFNEPVPGDMTVEDFKKLLLKECLKLSNAALLIKYPNREERNIHCTSEAYPRYRQRYPSI